MSNPKWRMNGDLARNKQQAQLKEQNQRQSDTTKNIEQSDYTPDLPGCTATGTTIEEVEEQMKEAIAFHIEGMREEGLEIPKPVTLCGYIETKVDVKI